MAISVPRRETVYSRETAFDLLLVELGTGRRGTIYEVAGAPDVAVKAYHSDEDRYVRARTLNKVDRMAADERIGSRRFGRVPLFAWPLALVFKDEQRTRPIGFAMWRCPAFEAGKGGYMPLGDVISLPIADEVGDARTLFKIALQIARIIAAAHAAGYTVCDIKDDNLLIYLPADGDHRQVGVTIVDCDSMQFSAGESVYKGEERNDDYVAPEVLDGAPFDQPADLFALAELVTSVLMLGEHPFSGVPHARAAQALDRAARVRQGLTPLLNTAAPKERSLLAVLPEGVTALARQCFGPGHRSPGLRPTADEWVSCLATVDLRECERNPRHAFARENATCPWCAHVAAGGRDPFRSPHASRPAIVSPPRPAWRGLGMPTAPVPRPLPQTATDWRAAFLVIAVIVAVIAGGIAIALGSDGAGETTAQKALIARLPTSLRDCQGVATFAGQADAAVRCHATGVDRVVYESFPSARAYGAYARDRRVQIRRWFSPFGRDCAHGGANGGFTTTWGKGQPATSGHMYCYRRRGEARLEWFENASRTHSVATRVDGQFDPVLRFWRSTNAPRR